ncbi:uncharacterized protein LOC135928456 [Gordionus sp. m RMFG-2023]|uniref:uncharacterized protein LOC135928456 n=1 Tax=Gordionus sp. m RMFG-2023 TaxID=3053472 RepID=UPI0031FDE645
MDDTESSIKINAKFKSIVDFNLALAIYEKQYFTNIVIHKSDILKPPNTKEDIIQFKYKRATFICKYGLQKVSRSRGIRKTSSLRKNCIFKLVVHLVKYTSGHYLVIHKLDDIHTNHELDEKLFKLLPKQRQLSPSKRQFVEQSLSIKGNKVKIQEVILKTGKMITLKDIHNIGSNLNKPSNNILFNVYQQLKEDNGAIVEIIEENNQLMGIFYQDSNMSHNLKFYPEVLFIDATYKLNNIGMPLFILLVIDSHGQSQIAALWLVKGETYCCVKGCCDILKKHNDINKIKVIIGDKDLADRQALFESFPNANIQICIFHVMCSFRSEITTLKRNITGEDVVTVLTTLQKLVYARSESEYNMLFCTYKFEFATGAKIFRYQLA